MRCAGVRLGQEDRKLYTPPLINSAHRDVVTELVQDLHAGPLEKIKVSSQYDRNSQRRPHTPALMFECSDRIVWLDGLGNKIELVVGLMSPRLFHLLFL